MRNYPVLNAWIFILLAMSLVALSVGCKRNGTPVTGTPFVREREEKPSLLVIFPSSNFEHRHYFLLEKLHPANLKGNFSCGVGLNDTMVYMRPLRNEPDPENPKNLLVQMEFRYNDEVFVSPLVSWFPKKDLTFFRGENWVAKLVGHYEWKHLK